VVGGRRGRRGIAEEGRAGGEDTQGPSAKARVAIKEEQERGHALREGEDGGVAGFVEGEAAGLVMAGVRVLGWRIGGAGRGQGSRRGGGPGGRRRARPSPVMASTEPEGVADEGDVAAGDVAEAAGEVREPRSAEVVGALASLSRRKGMEWRIAARRRFG